MPNPDDLIPTVEAAQILGVERSTLTRWAESGKIQVAQQLPGATGARLFRRADIEAKRDQLAGASSTIADGLAR